MKRTIAWLSLFLLGTAWAGPSSEVAWTPETLRLVKGGDAVKGKELAAQCISCHGENGVASNPAWPSLAGQLPAYTFKQLRDYKTKHRQNPMMAGVAAGLSDQDMADLAAYYAGLPPPPAKAGAGAKDGEKLAVRGDNKRLIPACAACHGGHGEGKAVDMAALAGQNADYLKQTLRAFREGKRANDIYSRMRNIAKALSDKEIEALAAYYAGLTR
ncbi:MAG: cytochrome c4 [Gammaproteobacteria bacterium]|nr:MAG: cytochrome c4 [Gammaproteobacteria bacterium]